VWAYVAASDTDDATRTGSLTEDTKHDDYDAAVKMDNAMDIMTRARVGVSSLRCSRGKVCLDRDAGHNSIGV